MSKPLAASTLYRLIEAGLLARQAVLAPLVERGLEPGDDAMLLALAEAPADRAGLVALLGGDSPALGRRLDRLVARGLVARLPLDRNGTPGLALTGRGLRMHARIEKRWRTVEAELLADIGKRQRRRLDKALRRILARL